MNNDETINSLLQTATATSSSFLSGFWIGKAVQLLQADDCDLLQNKVHDNKRVDDLLQDCREFESSLSRNVAERIFYAPDPKDIAPKIEDLLISEGGLNMSYFSKQNLVGKIQALYK